MTMATLTNACASIQCQTEFYAAARVEITMTLLLLRDAR